jgi:hypothetical protein
VLVLKVVFRCVGIEGGFLVNEGGRARTCGGGKPYGAMTSF